MLARLSGRTHEVLTAVALADSRGIEVRVNVSAVRFRTLGAEEVRGLLGNRRAPGQGGRLRHPGLGAVFIESVTGSYSGVMGLPLFETAQLLRSAGVPCWCRMQE